MNIQLSSHAIERVYRRTPRTVGGFTSRLKTQIRSGSYYMDGIGTRTADLGLIRVKFGMPSRGYVEVITMYDTSKRKKKQEKKEKKKEIVDINDILSPLKLPEVKSFKIEPKIVKKKVKPISMHQLVKKKREITKTRKKLLFSVARKIGGVTDIQMTENSYEREYIEKKVIEYCGNAEVAKSLLCMKSKDLKKIKKNYEGVYETTDMILDSIDKSLKDEEIKPYRISEPFIQGPKRF